MRLRWTGVAIAVAATTCVCLSANDKWELGFIPDDNANTPNQLLHGVVQTHDIEGITDPTDLDFSVVAAKAGHSYEVRLSSTNSCFGTGSVAGCGGIDRVASDGTTVLTPGFEPDGPLPNIVSPGWMAVRWITSADETDFIRVTGYVQGATANADDQYDIRMLDTTYLVPRWNNSGTQVTVFLIQNGSTSPIAGSILFYNATGALLATQPLSLAGSAVQAVSTAAIPALAGFSGSARIVHDGTYGALAGKAVALEPATGFTFDTLIAPIPY